MEFLLCSLFFKLSPLQMTGDGTDQTASLLKLVHAQKIEPPTVAGLNQ